MVCVSHATGSGGEDIGLQVAERLGYLYVDEEIVAGAAARGGVEPGDVADEERRKSLALRLLEMIAEGGAGGGMLGGVPPTADELGSTQIRALIRETVEQTAGRGKVVIVAHAASYAVEPGPTRLRVLVTASPRNRAKRIAESETLDEAQGARRIKDADAGRRDYLKRFYDVDRESPTDYDLVINTDVLSSQQAAEIVARAAGG